MELNAKNLTGDVSLPYVLSGSVKVVLRDGGGIPVGVQVNAPHLAMGTSWMEGDMAGTINVATLGFTGNYSLKVDGDLTGTCHVFDDVVYSNGRIRIGGDIRDGGKILFDGDFNGKVMVSGSLLNGATGPEIDVNGVMGADGAITIDWDGWDIGDTWQSGATIDVGATTYTGNSPTARIYEITECRGDLNNDGAVDFDDIDPLVAAIDGDAAYTAAFPSLGGSRGFHGDLDCDGDVDFDDIDPFVARIGQCCYPGCGPCPGGSSAASLSPTEMAAELATNVAPERLSKLCEIVQAAGEQLSNTSRRPYWQAVYQSLCQ